MRVIKGVLKSYICGLLLLVVLFLTNCTGEEQEVVPQQTCDTQATVQNLAGCGLVLVLKNNQILVPVNAAALPKISSEKQQYKINGFTVKEKQQVIIGFIDKGQIEKACLAGGQLVEITCIVGYEVQP
ncbi:hypothetical protein AHMF7605_10845 [Adhaeribacter arboris]|uniref:Uncharacterized protein n=1 Tax=Adhaeribacter arboris TaxID=2072846 RepID=A0A2T2YEP7_9BACT|nr:hypothetical protein [Adhaeribacter arboris]PSR53980.1 hypothetical protein AHMF7605_10845 [Adhaeribacter arboris]